MTLLDVLEDEIFDFPLSAADYFPEFLSQQYSKYLELLDSVDDEYSEIISNNIENIKFNTENLKEVINQVFIGHSSKAYEVFKLEIEKLDKFLTKRDKNAQDEIPYYLFRARIAKNEQLNLKDMFHVPFEKRYSILTSRFGVPGLPCLYLCNSIYTCWEEMDKPLFAQMPISRFEITGKVFNFLDLIPDIDRMKQSIKLQLPETSDLFKKYVLPKFLNVYPLWVACYTKVLNKNANFKPEYSIPQMLMQWVSENDHLDGIKYISTKCKPTNYYYFNPKPFINYAIPVKSFSEKGFCAFLTKHINLTEPITWELFNILNPEKASKELDFENDILRKYQPSPIINFSLIENRMDKYFKTQFGILEHELLNMSLKKIPNP